MARIRSQVMVGRDDDLRAILEMAEQARAGVPTLALVRGEAGIGKSRLVREFAARLQDGLVLVGHGVDLRTGEIAFGVVADTLGDLVRRRGEGVLTSGERALLGPLLPGSGVVGPSDPARLLSGAVGLFDRLAADGLVCWIVEDLQWTDPATRDLVSVLARRQAGRLLVVGTVRTAAGARDGDAAFAPYVDGLVRLPLTRTIDLRRLSVQDVQRQLADLLDQPLPREVVQQIVEVGDGVPFVVEELAAARGRPELSSAAAVAEARLGALSGSARRLVEAASLGDGHLRWALLEAVVDLTPEELDEAFVEAVRTGILEETTDRGSCRFRHALLRDAADRAIPPAARRGWHRRWADAISGRPGVVPPDIALLAVAEHWDQAAEPEQAALAALAAVPAARRTGAGPEELVLWRRLLDLWPKASAVIEGAGTGHDDVVSAVLRLAVGLGGGEEAVQLLDRLEREAVDDLEREAVRIRRLTAARAKTYGGSSILPPDQCVGWEALFRAHLPKPLARDSLAIVGHFSHFLDPRADAILGEVEALSAAAGDVGSVLMCRARMSWRIQARGDTGNEIELLEGAVTDFPDAPVHDLWSIEGNLIWALALAGRHEEAEVAVARALARVSDPISAGVSFEHIVENATYHWILTGQWDRAEDLIVAAQPYWGAGRRSSDVRLAELELLRTGRLSDVEGWRAAIGEPAVPMGASPSWIAETVAWHVAMEGDLPDMRRLLAASWVEADPVASDELWTAVLMAVRLEVDAAVRRPDPTDRPAAEAHLATIGRVAEQLHRYGECGAAWDAEVRAQLARFHGDPCGDLFADVTARWEAVTHPYDAAVTRLCLAEAALAEGDREAGRRDAEAVLATARGLGAGPLATAAEKLIARHRLASRVVESSGQSGSLTAREREVLALLAEGRTNEQIATELYMSPKTASVHVSRIIAKLGAANRTEAAAVARRVGLL